MILIKIEFVRLIEKRKSSFYYALFSVNLIKME